MERAGGGAWWSGMEWGREDKRREGKGKAREEQKEGVRVGRRMGAPHPRGPSLQPLRRASRSLPRLMLTRGLSVSNCSYTLPPRRTAGECTYNPTGRSLDR